MLFPETEVRAEFVDAFTPVKTVAEVFASTLVKADELESDTDFIKLSVPLADADVKKFPEEVVKPEITLTVVGVT
jgi:hypothetical protein